jgi:hypothetical protein
MMIFGDSYCVMKSFNFHVLIFNFFTLAKQTEVSISERIL